MLLILHWCSLNTVNVAFLSRNLSKPCFPFCLFKMSSANCRIPWGQKLCCRIVSSGGSTELPLNSVHQLFVWSIVQDDWHGERGAVAAAKSPGDSGETCQQHKRQEVKLIYYVYAFLLNKSAHSNIRQLINSKWIWCTKGLSCQL